MPTFEDIRDSGIDPDLLLLLMVMLPEGVRNAVIGLSDEQPTNEAPPCVGATVCEN